ncbi:hypothetical protein PQR68_20510 [Paraburkholderia agricolaris]|uniref:Uncharacterized protein n=1 Tax=Paraburkholderia agricolaris TaxID=2152888 RepID=A0ABW8ZNJ6_9BURK|nr:hypothetical protein [Paraburkholderia agricolaris]
MFVKSFVMFFGGAVRAPHPLRVAARAHLLAVSTSVPAAARAGVSVRADRSQRSAAASHFRRAGKMAARAAFRVVYAGNPLTPAGYAIVAVTVAAFVLVAMLCTSSIADELGRSLRLSWWFS